MAYSSDAREIPDRQHRAGIEKGRASRTVTLRNGWQFLVLLLRPGPARCGCYLHPTIPEQAEICGAEAAVSCGSVSDAEHRHRAAFCAKHWDERMPAHGLPTLANLKRPPRNL